MRILVSAYACEPGKGSEPGVGWNWVLAASRHHELCVLTRANNREPIEAAVDAEPLPSVEFVYLDLPSWARKWKRGRRGIRLYYTLWQLLVAREARRRCRLEHIDVVHHLTFANMWLPALACLAGPPFVLGPIGGGQRVPAALYPVLGPRGVATELLLYLRFLNRFNPLVRIAWSRSSVILANNRETLRSLPRRHRVKARIRPNACVPFVAKTTRDDLVDIPTAACVGHLNRFKAVELAIRAIAVAPEWRLVVIGDGPDRERLTQVAEHLGVADRVRFEGLLPQEEVWKRLSSCHALLLPSLKEGAPMVAAEAQMLGLPVVALDAHGPAALAETPGAYFELVQPRSEDAVVRGFAAALERVRGSSPLAERPDFGLDGVAHDVDRAYRAAANAPAPAREEVPA
jgi:glycosyltransferase involved in cell wall biosynthesis